MPKNKLIQAFEAAALALLGSKRASVILAVSGGCDSMVMASLFVACGFPSLSIAHVNFGLRGAESDADEALVRDWAKERQIPFYVKRCGTHIYATEHGLSIEMAARELRYEWFAHLLQETGFSHVALAHHANDSAETMLLNLVRGSGLRGLCGIPAQRGPFVRPMLGFERAALEVYAREQGVAYHTDATNMSPEFSRNRIRQNIWPELQQISPNLALRLRENARYFTQAQAILDAQLEEKKTLWCREDAGSLYVDIPVLQQEMLPSYWLFALLQPYGFRSAQMGAVMQLLDTCPGHRVYAPQYTLYRDRELLCLRARTEALIEEFLQVQYYPAADYQIVPDAGVAALDADKLSEPLLLRPWREGDRFCPLGMRSFKKVSDYLIDTKVPLWEKDNQQVLCCGEDIVWLAGRRIDERYKVDGSTLTVAEFRV
jgi:tRNA(Ile)-lysidine synthetase, N-terminal domain/tRNA(Ile)-lysidine synthetase, C-terminal domain